MPSGGMERIPTGHMTFQRDVIQRVQNLISQQASIRLNPVLKLIFHGKAGSPYMAQYRKIHLETVLRMNLDVISQSWITSQYGILEFQVILP